MKKRKKKKNNIEKRILIIIILFSFLFSYLEFKNDLTFGGVFKDLLGIIPKNDTHLFLNTISEELILENSMLKRYLELDYSLTDYTVINSSVVFRSDNFWLDELTINKGINDGIKENLAVVTDNGLIGKIKSVSFKTSTVKLITDIESISVEINNINKIMYSKNKELIIKGINKDDLIKVGDKVITNGLSNIFPKGIIIGFISEIKDDSSNIGKIAKVELSQDINNINYVAVLKRKDL